MTCILTGVDNMMASMIDILAAAALLPTRSTRIPELILSDCHPTVYNLKLQGIVTDF